jgi:hypothetical protein
MAARELVWLVRQDGRIELGRPGERYHSDLIKRLRLSQEDVQASGVIRDGRAVQLDPNWEPQVQALYENLYPPA